MPSSITVKTNGQTLSVNASISHWTTAALANAASTSNDVESSTWTTITSDYAMYFANTAQFVTVTVKQADGSTLHTGTYKAGPGAGARTVEPLPSALQVAADVQRRSLALAPSGALAETFPRNVGYISNVAFMTSGEMLMSAIDLPAGLTVTSISFTSATQAAVNPTAWWFALYDSALGLLGQTADQTTTAWAANTTKTVALATPFVTTYSGLHYLGVMVVAGTVPSFMMSANSTYVLNSIAPKLAGKSTSSLTTTAPATAAAITGQSGQLYAYVS